MKQENTERGFTRFTFDDGNGIACSLQKSSAAEDDLIWLGCNEIGLKRFTPGEGWRDVPLEDDSNWPFGVSHIANTRMHLTRAQVKALLPLLRKFVKTGELEP